VGVLNKKQFYFGRQVAWLILAAGDLGLNVALGEAYRSPETAAAYAKDGRGIAKSLHTKKLAIDLHLFRGDTYLTRTEDYAALGAWWEAQSTNEFKHCWGGHFSDGNHFSIEHEGVR
jgi:hypothetical protein